MVEMKNLDVKQYFTILIAIILLTDLIILLNIPFLRQILGFLFLTILPGLLILHILKLNKIDSTEKFVLAVGLSISFLMFFGLLINNSLLSIRYETPLATIPLLIAFNLAFTVLAIIGYKINKEATFSLPYLNLTTSEKALLIIPIFLPALTIFGTYIMNTTDNNIILIFLLFSISIYVVFIGLFNHKFPKRLYPVVIFLISLSILLMLALTSNHLIGRDTHAEYHLFRITMDNLHWNIIGCGPFDACLSISLLPTIYQSFLNVNHEYLFKILYPLLYSISPLIIYVISKKYVRESYAFLASLFFMSQHIFIDTTSNSRTCIAVLFFALSMMVLFNDEIDPFKKRILFIIFMASCVVSHYSTTYIFFFILLGAFVGMEILSKKYLFKKVTSLTIMILFFSLIFFWYSQITETAFNAGVGFIEETFLNLNRFFVMESRAGGGASAVLGAGITQKGIPHKIEFVFTWMTFALIGIGIFTLIRRYREMVSIPETNVEHLKTDFLKRKFEPEYLVLTLACAGLLVAIIALPFVSQGYGMPRAYSLCITILSVFFVIGGITLSKHFFFLQKNLLLRKSLYGKFASQKTCAKRKSCFFGKAFFNGENGSQVRAYLIILLVLIPYFLCVTGATYQMFGYKRAIALNSEGEWSDWIYIHDQDIIGVKWLEDHSIGSAKDLKIYSDHLGGARVALACDVNKRPRVSISFFKDNKTVNDGYIYLRYANVVEEKVYPRGYNYINITEYSHLFIGKSKLYNNGGSEIYK